MACSGLYSLLALALGQPQSLLPVTSFVCPRLCVVVCVFEDASTKRVLPRSLLHSLPMQREPGLLAQPDFGGVLFRAFDLGPTFSRPVRIVSELDIIGLSKHCVSSDVIASLHCQHSALTCCDNSSFISYRCYSTFEIRTCD